MFTLEASQLEVEPPWNLYTQKWIMQEWGTHVRVESGYIALSGEIFCHGLTVDAALDGIKKSQGTSNYSCTCCC